MSQLDPLIYIIRYHSPVVSADPKLCENCLILRCSLKLLHYLLTLYNNVISTGLVHLYPINQKKCIYNNILKDCFAPWLNLFFDEENDIGADLC